MHLCYCHAGPHVSFPQGATDSEKRVLCLSAENESLKQNLSLTQGLLQQLTTIPSQSSTMLIKVTCTNHTDVLPKTPLVTSNTNNAHDLLCLISFARRTRTSAAECSSWRCLCSSVLSSCHTWSDGANRASGGEERSWGNERSEWGSCSWS